MVAVAHPLRLRGMEGVHSGSANHVWQAACCVLCVYRQGGEGAWYMVPCIIEYDASFVVSRWWAYTLALQGLGVNEVQMFLGVL